MSVLDPKSSGCACCLKGQNLDDVQSLSNGLRKDDLEFTQTLDIEIRSVFFLLNYK